MESKCASLLVVDDNEINRKVLQGQLAILGYSVHLVDDGHSAIDAFKKNTFALVFMDCEMHGLDGFAATQAIRKFEKDAGRKPTPILAFTGHTSEDIKILAQRAGMNELVNKPIDTEALRRIVLKWLG